MVGIYRSELAAAVAADGLRPTLSASSPAPLNRLIERCWQLDPALRPSAADVANELRRMRESGCWGQDEGDQQQSRACVPAEPGLRQSHQRLPQGLQLSTGDAAMEHERMAQPPWHLQPTAGSALHTQVWCRQNCSHAASVLYAARVTVLKAIICNAGT